MKKFIAGQKMKKDEIREGLESVTVYVCINKYESKPGHAFVIAHAEEFSALSAEAFVVVKVALLRRDLGLDKEIVPVGV